MKTNFKELLESMKNGEQIIFKSHLNDEKTSENLGYEAVQMHRLSKKENFFYLEGALLPSPEKETLHSMSLILQKFELRLLSYDRILLKQDPLDINNYKFTKYLDKGSFTHSHTNWISVHLIGSAPIVFANYSDLDMLINQQEFFGIPNEIVHDILNKVRELMDEEDVFKLTENSDNKINPSQNNDNTFNL